MVGAACYLHVCPHLCLPLLGQDAWVLVLGAVAPDRGLLFAHQGDIRGGGAAAGAGGRGAAEGIAVGAVRGAGGGAGGRGGCPAQATLVGIGVLRGHGACGGRGCNGKDARAGGARPRVAHLRVDVHLL